MGRYILKILSFFDIYNKRIKNYYCHFRKYYIILLQEKSCILIFPPKSRLEYAAKLLTIIINTMKY